MRIARRVLSPIVVLVGYVAGFYALRWLTAGSFEPLGDLRTIADHPPTFDQLLIALIAVLAWLCYLWLALGTVLMALSAIPGAMGRACGSIAEKVTPAAYRKAAKFALGISLAAGPILGSGTAFAAPVDNPTQVAAAAQLPSLDRPGATGSQLPGLAQLPSLDRPGSVTPGGVQHGLPTPDRPISGQAGASATPDPTRPTTGNPLERASRGADAEVATHVVKRGDTLWDIAKSHLPAGATSAQINHEWHRWYDYNRQVIGGDPNLILPGQVLHAPPSNFHR